MRKLIMVILIILLLSLGLVLGKTFLPLAPGENETPENGDKPGDVKPEPKPQLQTATFVAVGGIYPHRPILNQARLGDGSYNFSSSFEFIAPHFQAADLAMLILETKQAGPDITAWGVSGYTGHPVNGVWTFNAPIQLSEALKNAGINMYVTANNHALDRGLEGLKATLKNVRSLGFHTTGTYLSREERDTPDIVELNGIKVAFIAYTYGTNGLPLPAGHEYAVNIAPFFEDITPIINDITSARAAGADLVAVIPHWGGEYVDAPTPHLRGVARELAEAGADIILGGHPKFVQPMEWLYVESEDGTARPVLVVYALGNFFTNQHFLPPYIPSDLVEFGLLLNIELTKDVASGEAWISDVGYDIHWCYRDWGYRMLVLSEVFEHGPERYNLTAAQFQHLKERHKRNIEIIERYGFSKNSPWRR